MQRLVPDRFNTRVDGLSVDALNKTSIFEFTLIYKRFMFKGAWIPPPDVPVNDSYADILVKFMQKCSQLNFSKHQSGIYYEFNRVELGLADIYEDLVIVFNKTLLDNMELRTRCLHTNQSETFRQQSLKMCMQSVKPAADEVEIISHPLIQVPQLKVVEALSPELLSVNGTVEGYDDLYRMLFSDKTALCNLLPRVLEMERSYKYFLLTSSSFIQTQFQLDDAELRELTEDGYSRSVQGAKLQSQKKRKNSDF
ncbi:hypothetical protein BCR33DRAFT_788895 [Rhizoclosmatium globosum]|uniref:Uncharacterized protein n=1 Tax=Rhizoclosmatium globosum TaxID=329046 RepID=A0A1Y2BVN2_9FUNG|nr:hypothetical protein BCR33DRAFT_788895 [Rhizoclosmatium globosum]|eukprot:ORY38687.1 hypothetical protein BCR33DRAFT_788895 [Rhizoclosmatium globosum]